MVSFRPLARIWRVLTVYAALNNLRSYQFPYPREDLGDSNLHWYYAHVSGS